MSADVDFRRLESRVVADFGAMRRGDVSYDANLCRKGETLMRCAHCGAYGITDRVTIQGSIPSSTGVVGCPAPGSCGAQYFIRDGRIEWLS